MKKRKEIKKKEKDMSVLKANYVYCRVLRGWLHKLACANRQRKMRGYNQILCRKSCVYYTRKRKGK